MFLNGKIEDPSLDKPLYISAFRQDDGSYNIVWSRPNRRRDAPTDTAPADDSLPPLPGADEPAKPNGLAGTDGLGESSAEGAFGGEPAQGQWPPSPHARDGRLTILSPCRARPPARGNPAGLVCLTASGPCLRFL
jgi:hypothetical protein